MVDQSSTLVRAAALRSSALSLAKSLLDRVEVGAVGRQVEDAGAGRRDRLADARDLVRGEVVHDHDVAGGERRREELLDVGAEGLPVIGPSSTSGAMMPVPRRPATKVVVRQWPWARHRPGARPWGTSRSGGPCWCSRRSRPGTRSGRVHVALPARQRPRCAATSGRSCSVALSDFFCAGARAGAASTRAS